MQTDKTLVAEKDKVPFRELPINKTLKIRVYADRLEFLETDPETDTKEYEVKYVISSQEGMDISKFLVHLLPIGQKLHVAASLTTAVAKAIG